MTLSQKSIETLLDLVEIRLGSLQIFDKEDARALKVLDQCRTELRSLASPGSRGVVAQIQRNIAA